MDSFYATNDTRHPHGPARSGRWTALDVVRRAAKHWPKLGPSDEHGQDAFDSCRSAIAAGTFAGTRELVWTVFGWTMV